MLLNSHREGPARRFHWARFTVFHRELDLENLVVRAIDGWRPTHTLPSRWTAHLLRLPIDLEEAFIKALLLFPLPLVISTGGRDQINPILLATLDKWFGLGHKWCPSHALSATPPLLSAIDGSPAA